MHPVLRTVLGLLVVIAVWPASAAEPKPLRLPDGSALEQVDFDRHVASLFGRLGCNTGACHGSFQGRGGLNLSLFGHDPARDYATLTRNALGRRVDVIDPDRSLVLLKPTGQVPHEGGQRFTGRLVGVPGHPRLDRRGGAGAIHRGGRSSGSRSAPAP